MDKKKQRIDRIESQGAGGAIWFDKNGKVIKSGGTKGNDKKK